MSVGGIVIRIFKDEIRKEVLVNTLDDGEEGAVLMELNPDSIQIEIGDTLWWHGDCLWTPKDRRIVDKFIPKIGYSGIDSVQWLKIGKANDLSKFNEMLLQSQEILPVEFEQVLYENLWDLYD